jgi:ATP-dependent exoDNAse (exonuclease V) beta subunit
VRTNAGGIRYAMNAVRDGKRPYLNKASVVKSFMNAVIKLQSGRRVTHPDLGAFENWAEVEEYSASEAGSDLKLMVSMVNEFGAQQIIDVLESGAKNEESADVAIYTAHTSKGREWDTVLIGEDFRPKKEDAEMNAEALRLAYVACTRAKFGLDLSAVPHFVGQAPAGPEEVGTM